MVDSVYTPKEIQSLIGLVDTYKRWINFTNKNKRNYKHYHPSELGKCLRNQQYKHYVELGFIKVEFQENDSQTLRLFDKGNNMHSRWVDYFIDIGILRGCWKCNNVGCFLFDDNGEFVKQKNSQSIHELIAEGKSRIHGQEEKLGIFKPEKCICGCKNFSYQEISVFSEALNIKGNADLILDCSNLDVNRFTGVRTTFDHRFLPSKGQKVVADMKSIGQSSWDYQLVKRGPHKPNLIQVQTYVNILDCDYGILIYENKNNSDMKWYKVEKNPEWWEVIQWQVNMMKEMVKEKKLPPPRYDDKSCFDCKKCEFSKLCFNSSVWNDPNFDKKRKNFYKALL